MEVTLYRYKMERPNWTESSINKNFFTIVVSEMMKLPFEEKDPVRQFGFTTCNHQNKIIYGFFVQKFSTVLTDFDPKTKEEIKNKEIDSGKYLFLFNPQTYELYLQNKRSSDLPRHEEIVKRFTRIFRLALNNTHWMFRRLLLTHKEVNRDRITKIFYEEADEILEMEFSKFDVNLINEEKEKRGGKLQKYFNPKEQYQEAMNEAAISISLNAEKASVKAKKGGNLKKDPITRAMLEGSRQPLKIVYKKNKLEYRDSAIVKKKEVISIEGSEINLSNIEIIGNIINKIFFESNKKVKQKVYIGKKSPTLFG